MTPERYQRVIELFQAASDWTLMLVQRFSPKRAPGTMTCGVK